MREETSLDINVMYFSTFFVLLPGLDMNSMQKILIPSYKRSESKQITHTVTKKLIQIKTITKI